MESESEESPQKISLEDLEPTYVPLRTIKNEELAYLLSPPSIFVESENLQSDLSNLLQCSEDKPISSNLDEEVNINLDESENSADEEIVKPFKFLHITTEEVSDDEEFEDVRSNLLYFPKTYYKFTNENPGQTHIPFSGTPGLRINCARNPIDFFRLIADDIFFEHIMAEINLYGEYLKLNDIVKGQKNRINWRPVTRGEFERFLALLFLIGHVKTPELSWYWKSHICHFPIFSVIMSKHRFLDILDVFHIIRFEENIDSSDRLIPLNIFHNNMKKFYYPQKELTIDESVVSWQGQLYFRQNVANKKHKFGIKIHTLTETNGLVLKIHMHVCSSAVEARNNITYDQIVYKLLSDFQGKGHVIFLDETFTNYPLVKNLLEKKIHTTGMLKKFRTDNPFNVINAKLKRGEIFQQFSPEGICVMKYYDKEPVFMISSEHSAIMKTITIGKKDIEKPKIFLDYNLVMDDVKKTDQFLMYYPCEPIRLFKWPPRLGIHIFHIIMYNSYILFNHFYRNLELLEFRESVIRALLNAEVLDNFHINRIHMPMILGRKVRKNYCVVCYRKQKMKISRFICSNCPDKPGLCMDKCFREYHYYH